jgi:hypothetical protein
MSAVQGASAAPAMPPQVGSTMNPDAAHRAVASAPPLVAFRTLLLERETAATDSGRMRPAALSLAPPSALVPSPRSAPGPVSPEGGRRANEEDPAESGVGSAAHRRAGDFEQEPLLSIPPPVITPPPFAPRATDPQLAASARAASSLEDLLPALVRRIAWSGDGQRGSVRLELGAGELAGAILVVHADAGRVSIQMDVPPGTDAVRWENRFRERLAARGLPTDAVEVT